VDLNIQRAQLIERILELERKVCHTLRPIVPTEWLNIDLTMPQLKIILIIFTDGPARISTLASTLGVSLSTTTGITDRLIHQDLIVRGNDPEDRRAVVCSLTDKGRGLATRLWEQGQSRMRDLLGKMELSQLKTISEAIETVLEAASLQGEDISTEPDTQ
jgi:DNA-binding MarR family transcriptional regulator